MTVAYTDCAEGLVWSDFENTPDNTLYILAINVYVNTHSSLMLTRYCSNPLIFKARYIINDTGRLGEICVQTQNEKVDVSGELHVYVNSRIMISSNIDKTNNLVNITLC